jgi:hypothetical protein
MLLRLVQSPNAQAPMLGTLSGMVTLLRLRPLSKAAYPILARRLGRMMFVRLLQYQNA